MKRFLIVTVSFLLMTLAEGCVPLFNLFKSEVNADPFGKNDGYSVLGFKVGNTTYQQIVPSWKQEYSNGAGCSMLHCLDFYYLDKELCFISQDYSRYDIDLAQKDTLWVSAIITCHADGSNPFPTFAYSTLAFAVDMKDVEVGDSIELSGRDVYLYYDSREWKLYPEKYTSSKVWRLPVSSFSLRFETIDYDQRVFSGSFTMKWTVDIDSGPYSFETDSGFFYMDMKQSFECGVGPITLFEDDLVYYVLRHL